MKFDIYQAKTGNFFADILPAESYTKVATVEAKDLDDVYHQSQNIESSWLQNPNVSSQLTQCRSTSVGDIIFSHEENQNYMVMNIGFEKVDVLK